MATRLFKTMRFNSPSKQFGPVFDPVSKLSLGQLNSIIYIYSAFLLVAMNKLAGELKRYENKNLLQVVQDYYKLCS